MTTCECGADTTNKAACECGLPVTYVPRAKAVKPPLESLIKDQIRKAVIDAGCIIWVHNVDNRGMSTGLGRGVADLIGIVPPYGRFLAIEVKRPKVGKVSEDQRCFLSAVRKFHGVSGVATCVEEALALIDEARQLP